MNSGERREGSTTAGAQAASSKIVDQLNGGLERLWLS